MISEKLNKELNAQLNKEFYSAYLYLAMESYFTSINLNGFANFFHVQLQEERDHAMMFFNYINKVGGSVTFEKIDAPKSEYSSAEEVFSDALKHEQFVTKSIYNIVDSAMQEKDHKTIAFLQWFVTEQTEEEETVGNVLKKLKLIGNDARALLLLDNELAQRVYTPPAQTV